MGTTLVNFNVFQYAKLILPHVGLVLLLLIYLLIGASIFQRIEGPNEIIVSYFEFEATLYAFSYLCGLVSLTHTYLLFIHPFLFLDQKQRNCHDFGPPRSISREHLEPDSQPGHCYFARNFQRPWTRVF